MPIFLDSNEDVMRIMYVVTLYISLRGNVSVKPLKLSFSSSKRNEYQ